MKTKILVLAALIGATALSANAGVRFGFSVGLPVPVVVTAPGVVVAAPYYAPAPVAVVPTVPVYAGPGYVCASGYGPYYRGVGYVWGRNGWRGYPSRGGYYGPGRRR